MSRNELRIQNIGISDTSGEGSYPLMPTSEAIPALSEGRGSGLVFP